MITPPSSVSVLVVEDEILVRMGIVDFLEDQGFLVFEAASAAEALRVLISTPVIQVMFTDVDMPGGMDGLKLAAAVRDRWPPIKIIVTSGHWRQNPEEMPDDTIFFAKPYNFEAVAATLRQMSP
jgi:CheY-like chemotaxis protein